MCGRPPPYLPSKHIVDCKGPSAQLTVSFLNPWEDFACCNYGKSLQCFNVCEVIKICAQLKDLVLLLTRLGLPAAKLEGNSAEQIVSLVLCRIRRANVCLQGLGCRSEKHCSSSGGGPFSRRQETLVREWAKGPSSILALEQ